jgi:cation transport regulator ChaC
MDYIRNTIQHMAQLGVRDPHLERVLRAAAQKRGQDPFSG